MHVGKRYTIFQILKWSSRPLMFFVIYDTLIIVVHELIGFEWLHLPWQPISLIGIAVAFYLGFKNNSSYDRLWEARNIWGGMVNASRSITVMIRDFVNNSETKDPKSEEELSEIRKKLVHRHVAWLHCLTYELRKSKNWEHQSDKDNEVREMLGVGFNENLYNQLKPYISVEDHDYIITKGNKSSHLLSVQSKDMMTLRNEGIIEHFRHLELQSMITELYTLQGKAERIKNFPFPRQYASVNFFFTTIFVLILPLGMIDIFHEFESMNMLWIAIPFSVVCSWVFWVMEMIGDYSENPFEGLYNDVPITSMARGIEIDIRQMLDETNLPAPIGRVKDWDIIM